MPYALIAALLMALVTYLPRVLPIAVFRKEIKSTYIKSFLRYVPMQYWEHLRFRTFLVPPTITALPSAALLSL